MFDIAWPELALIAAVALVVIGPKDLPKVLMTLGQWTRKARLMAREFQTGIDDLVREAEVAELRKQADTLHAKTASGAVETLIDPTGVISDALASPIMSDTVPPLAAPTSAMSPDEAVPPAVTASSVVGDPGASEREGSEREGGEHEGGEHGDDVPAGVEQVSHEIAGHEIVGGEVGANGGGGDVPAAVPAAVIDHPDGDTREVAVPDHALNPAINQAINQG